MRDPQRDYVIAFVIGALAAAGITILLAVRPRRRRRRKMLRGRR